MNMDNVFGVFSRGFNFVRQNPQIIYTLFLVIAIPLAFFFTSEQFLQVARENQNRLERSRIGLLQDTFALFASEYLGDGAYLAKRIAAITGKNETMMTFQVLGLPEAAESEGESFPVIASMTASEEGKKISLDPLSRQLVRLAEHESYAAEFFEGGVRYWRSVHAIIATSTPDVVGYVVTDLSMAQADSVARKNIQNAYIILAGIIVLIIGLLARQARIIDYAALYQRLKELDQMKDDFVSMAAHELRSPLTVIRGYVEMLGEGEGLSLAGKGHLKNIDNAALQLNALVGDILDVEKLQGGRMTFTYEKIDASEMIADTVTSFAKSAANKGLGLFYEKAPLPSISVDPDRFRQVMINLIGNAIKYTPEGEVRVRASADGKLLTIRVSDTGMGISAEEQQKLFQKFYRVKSAETEKITGTGLGLWIVSQIVKTMKGTISVESIKGKGADFILTFPIVK